MAKSSSSKSGSGKSGGKDGGKDGSAAGTGIELSKKMTFLIVSIIVALVAAVLGLGYLLIKKAKGGGGRARSHHTTNTFNTKKKETLLTSTSQVESLLEKAKETGPAVFLIGHPGCGHCVDTVPVFEEAAGDKAGASVFVVDANQCDSSLLTKLDISVYPTVLKYTSPTTRKEYDDDARTVESFKAFIGGS